MPALVPPPPQPAAGVRWSPKERWLFAKWQALSAKDASWAHSDIPSVMLSQRYNSARTLWTDRQWRHTAEGWQCQGSGGAWYTVSGDSCNCPDRRAPGGWCKHRIALWRSLTLGLLPGTAHAEYPPYFGPAADRVPAAPVRKAA